MLDEIRAAELTADSLGRTVRIDPGDRPFLRGRLVRARHKLVRDEMETRLEIEGPEDQLIPVRFNSVGVVELL